MIKTVPLTKFAFENTSIKQYFARREEEVSKTKHQDDRLQVWKKMIYTTIIGVTIIDWADYIYFLSQV